MATFATLSSLRFKVGTSNTCIEISKIRKDFRRLWAVVHLARVGYKRSGRESLPIRLSKCEIFSYATDVHLASPLEFKQSGARAVLILAVLIRRLSFKRLSPYCSLFVI